MRTPRQPGGTGTRCGGAALGGGEVVGPEGRDAQRLALVSTGWHGRLRPAATAAGRLQASATSRFQGVAFPLLVHLVELGVSYQF